MKVLAALVLAMGVSWGAITTASAEPPGDASPLVGKWCLERPRALKYGSRLGLVIDEVTDSRLSGQYNWEGSDALNTRLAAKSEGNVWEFWADKKIWYRLDKTLDARGRIVGTGGNNVLKITWPALFRRVADTKPAVDREGVRVMVPDCPAG